MTFQIKRRQAAAQTDLPAGLTPLLKRIYASRGIQSAEQLARDGRSLLNPRQLMGMEQAVSVIADAMQQQQKILIVGDFDADGATSTTLCILALRALGAQHVDFLVPNRFDYGYGLSPEIVAVADKMAAKLLITVDNGISSVSGVAAAKQRGMRVVVTDHHLPGKQLPDADAIVNPNQVGCDFASKALAGVGVAFYLMSALRVHLRGIGWFDKAQITEPNLTELLDVVALGTVADVVPLDTNNRILVHQGLMRIRSGRCRPGIRALIELSGRTLSRLNASDLGFAVGPRLNAAGRLDDMALGINCLLAENEHSAREMAAALDNLNRERREIEQGMQQQALMALEALQQQEDDMPKGLCLFQPDWHQGVIGILASRIKERYHRPVIAFAQADDGTLKGSARSIAGLHMRDLLERIDTSQPGLISKFGGHAMAAGLSIAEKDYPRFSEAYAVTVDKLLSEDQLTGVVMSDGELTPTELNLQTAQLLAEAGPWGQAFEEPMFDGEFDLLQQRLVGERHLKMVLSPDRGQTCVDAIAFNIDIDTWPNAMIRRVRIAYQLDANHFRGEVSLQLRVQHIQPI